jgi:thioredoxin-dependent peroxiredoxin
LKPSFDELNTKILGASFDTQKANADFAKKFDFNFPLLCDTDREIGMAYHACDSPDQGSARRISYIIDPEGRIARTYDKVEAAKHPQQVLNDLAEAKKTA